MNINDFLKLSENDREMLVEIHQTQKIIRNEYQTLKKQKENIEVALANLQIKCTHPFAMKIAKENSNTVDFKACPDCGDIWDEDPHA